MVDDFATFIGACVIVLGCALVIGALLIFTIEKVVRFFDLTVTIAHFALKKKGFRIWRRQKMALHDLVTLRDYYKTDHPGYYAEAKERTWQEARDALADDGRGKNRKDD